MNRTHATSALVAGLLFAVGAAQAGASTNARMLNGKSVHGEVVSATQHTRVVNVDAGKAVNVACGDVVTFQSGAKRFTWKFDSAGHRALDVRDIAPAGFSDKELMVYVSRNEDERG